MNVTKMFNKRKMAIGLFAKEVMAPLIEREQLQA
jgi:hypothetical protein